MSGIAGVFFRDNRLINSDELARMTNSLAHRGPDGARTWYSGSVGLGHRMLLTTPESLRECLPYTYNHCTITADARVDNREDLIAALDLTSPPELIPDSQLILHAYERWGEASPEHLLGDFAFAIWDESRQTLFCARDHMGITPFYYYSSDELFAFASEIKGLFYLSAVPRELNESAIAFRIAYEYNDRQKTEYEGILRLPAAHSLAVSQSAIQFRRYWSLDPTYELRLSSDEAYENAFRHILTEAVRCRLRSAFPVCSELSGGLDSSSVTCLAQFLLNQGGLQADSTSTTLHTLSTLCGAPDCDERFYMDAVLKKGGYSPHFNNTEKLSPLEDVHQIVWHTDQPPDAPNSAALWKSLSTAREAGIRVLLTGLGGDHCGSTYKACMIELLRRGKILTALQEVNALAKTGGKSLGRVALQFAFLPLAAELAPDAVVAIWRKHRPKRDRTTLEYTYIRPDFAKRVGLLATADVFSSPDYRRRSERELHCDVLTHGYNQYVFEERNKIGAAHSLELRHPYFDVRVIEFSLALPPEQKLRGGYTRAIVRRALASYLPSEIRSRTSKSFSDTSLNRALRTHASAQLRDLLLVQSASIEDYIDLSKLRDDYYRLNETDGDLLRMWPVAMLVLWLQQITEAWGLGVTDGSESPVKQRLE